MWFTSRWRLALVSGAVALSTAFGVTGSSADPGDYTPWPGLPKASDLDPTRPGYELDYVPLSWAGIAQSGRAGSVAGKQWARIPVTLMAVQYFIDTLPASEVQPPFLSRGLTDLWSFFVSPKGSEHNYGESAPITVRTVAFGSIPVEVKLQVVQQRLSNGTPKPVKLTSAIGIVRDTFREYAESLASNDAVFTRVSGIKVDGVDLELGAACQTAAPGALKLKPTFFVATTNDPRGTQGEYDPGGDEDLLLGTAGGNLSGTIDIGRFAGCRTKSGDDISPLLTSAISGPDNPLRIRLGVLNCFTASDDFSQFLPPPPGAETPEEGYCNALIDDPTNPDYPKYVTIPKPMDLPNYAPGEQPSP